jgi:SAM-dependent methyltransferase
VSGGTQERAQELAKRLRRAVAPLATKVDERLFPEAATGADQWQRVVMNREVTKFLRSLGPAGLTAVEISGDGQAGLGWKRFVSLNYPQFDICDPTPQDTYDVVICEQVLEHVLDPFAAAANLRALCAPGGHVVVTTPFLIKVHELPMFGMKDYWRFTPRGIQVLLERAGLEVVDVGTWGNRVGVWSNLARWSAMRPWHPQGNNPETPVVVWAFARNPA